MDDVNAIETALRTSSPQVDTTELSANFWRLAETSGLLDVAYATTDSPVGRILAAVTPRGLVRLHFPADRPDEVLEELARRVSPRVLESASRLDGVRRQLDEYFDRRRSSFDMPIDWRLSDGFVRRALRVAARIPFGSVLTYSQVAERAGSPRGARAAGNAMGANPIPIVVPCHRVIRAGGVIGHYGGGPERKRFLLGLEGVALAGL